MKEMRVRTMVDIQLQMMKKVAAVPAVQLCV